MQAVTRSERVVVAGYLNGHVGIDRAGYNNVRGGHGLDVVNEDGIQVLDFATAYEMRIMNTFYQKRRNHLVTYNSGERESQIDYIMNTRRNALTAKFYPKRQSPPSTAYWWQNWR